MSSTRNQLKHWSDELLKDAYKEYNKPLALPEILIALIATFNAILVVLSIVTITIGLAHSPI